MTIDAPMPDEVVDIVDMFLMGLRGKESFREPGSTKEGPKVVVVE